MLHLSRRSPLTAQNPPICPRSNDVIESQPAVRDLERELIIAAVCLWTMKQRQLTSFTLHDPERMRGRLRLGLIDVCGGGGPSGTCERDERLGSERPRNTMAPTRVS
ncbi:hypothetical protein GN956_G2652 [Arapaima gigas]